MVFDVLACDGWDLRRQPYHERRQALVECVPSASGRVQLVANTSDRYAAREWMDPGYGAVGIEGVVSKRIDAAYRGRCGWWNAARWRMYCPALAEGVHNLEYLICRVDSRTVPTRRALCLGTEPGTGGSPYCDRGNGARG